jgi:DNA-binding GntR family transcriptional regulator
MAQLNMAFHRCILDTGQSWYLAMFMDKIHDAVRLFRVQSIYLPGRVAAIIRDHEDILRDFEERDEEAAIRHITAHVDGALKALIDQYHPGDEGLTIPDVA